MRPAALAAIVEAIRPGAVVVELGSGASTVVIARAARGLGARLVSVEHDGDWAGRVRSLLGREELDRIARVVEAPLVPGEAAQGVPVSEPFRAPPAWYAIEELRAACPPRIDVLVVDGPPGGDSPRVLARGPAVPALRDRLAGEWAVFLDDASRPAERRTAEAWRQTLGCDLALRDELDLAVLRPSPPSPSPQDRPPSSSQP